MKNAAELRPDPDAAAETPAVIHLPDLMERSKKVTSGSANRQRRHLEQFRTDDGEHAALREKARASGLSFGAYMRASNLGDAGPRARRRAPVDIAALMQALVALNRVGNNQNQIARALNELLLIAREQGHAQAGKPGARPGRRDPRPSRPVRGAGRGDPGGGAP